MRIGIDLGGTKIAGVALAKDGTELCRRRVPTPRGDYRKTLAAIASLADEIEAVGRAELEAQGTKERSDGSGGGRLPLGVGIPGAISPRTGRVKNANSTWLIGEPLDQDLAERADRRVVVDNDANCFAVSEAADGAGAGAAVVFGAILGTGCGGGLVVDGRPLGGANAVAGEWGHNPLPWPTSAELVSAPACYCGRRGCLETWISGTGFARDFAASSSSDRPHGKSGVPSPPLLAPAIVAAARAGDAAAGEALDRLFDRIARGFASVINLVDPDVIVVGGGLSHVSELYDEVPARWGAHVFSDTVETRLVPPRWGDDSGVRGAAYLIADDELP